MHRDGAVKISFGRPHGHGNACHLNDLACRVTNDVHTQNLIRIRVCDQLIKLLGGGYRLGVFIIGRNAAL